MKDLNQEFKNITPNLNLEFKPFLEKICLKGGGATDTVKAYGKFFENFYECFIYCYFLGLYKNEYSELPSDCKKYKFNVPIEKWGSKGEKVGRKDFSQIQDFIFISAIQKSNIELLDLEKGEITEKIFIEDLQKIVESYANGGLILIKEILEDNPNYFASDSNTFLNLIVNE